MMKFFEHRIADRRMLRLLQKWLNAGVLHDGKWTASEEGTPQGATVSPLAANVYLHYVLDLWVQQWRSRRARGDVIVVRFADDFLVGFESKIDAEQFLGELRKSRLANRWLPPACTTHPFPEERFHVTTRGKSPVR